MVVVVVAEDEPLIRMDIADELTEAGFVVLEARCASEALAILATEAAGVHALFTDVRMPGSMDGIALSHRVRAAGHGLVCW